MLEPLLGGELSGRKSREVRKHLAGCGACASRLSILDRTELLPVLDEAIEPDGQITSRFSARLAAHRRLTAGAGSSAASRWWSAAARGWPRRLAAAGVLALVALGLYYLRYPGQDAQNSLASYGEIEAAQNLPLLREMALIGNLELLEDLDTMDAMPADRAPLSEH